MSKKKVAKAKKAPRSAQTKKYPVLKRKSPGVKYLSPSQVSKRLKVSLPTVYGWVSKRLFKGMTRDFAGRWLIPSEGLKKPPVPAWHFSAPKSAKKKVEVKKFMHLSKAAKNGKKKVAKKKLVTA